MTHKSIPCPECNRIWLWNEDKIPEYAVCPKGIGCHADTNSNIIELLKKVLRRLDDIETKVDNIPSVPKVDLSKTTLGATRCLKCGMEWTGIMGYSCSDMDCPVQVKVGWQTYNVTSTTNATFDIESPDPAKRSWYYDGDGTRRKKR